MVKQATSDGLAPAAPAPAPAGASYSNPAMATGGEPRFAGAVKGIRIAQLILGLIVLALTAYVVSAASGTYCDGYGYCYTTRVFGQISFNLFAGLWAFLICCYLVPAAFKPSIYHPIAALVLDALAVIFWFAGFISLAVLTGAIGDYYGVDNNAFAVLAAAAAMGAISWVLFVFTLVATALGFASHQKAHAHATPMQQYPTQQQYPGQGVAQHA